MLCYTIIYTNNIPLVIVSGAKVMDNVYFHSKNKIIKCNDFSRQIKTKLNPIQIIFLFSKSLNTYGWTITIIATDDICNSLYIWKWIH